MKKSYCFFCILLLFTTFSKAEIIRSFSIDDTIDFYQINSQTILFDPLPIMKYGDPDYLLTASSDAGLQISYTSSNNSVAEVYQDSADNLWKLKINAVGTVTITANQEGNESTSAALAVSQNLTVDPATLIIVADSKSKLYNEEDPVFTYTVSGLINADTAETVLSGSLTRIAGENIGTYSILQGTLSTTSSYLINYVGANLQIVRSPLPDDIILENETFVYDGTPKSILVDGDIPVEVTISYTGNEQVNAGEYVVTAFIDGGENYESVTLTATLEILKSPQTIEWEQNLITGCKGERQLILEAVSSSGLPIEYSSSNPIVATVNGNVLNIITAGYSDITAKQIGNQNYLEADTIIKQLNVRLIGKVKQKWNDVLVFDNSTNAYISWQWYRDGSLLTGATRQYYTSAPAQLSGIYYAVVEDTGRNFMETCPFTVLDGISKGGIKVSPNPSPRNVNIKILSDYTEEELKGARLLITDINGNVYREFTMVAPEMNFPAPANPAMYIIYLYFPTGDKTTVKLLVN